MLLVVAKVGENGINGAFGAMGGLVGYWVGISVWSAGVVAKREKVRIKKKLSFIP